MTPRISPEAETPAEPFFKTRTMGRNRALSGSALDFQHRDRHGGTLELPPSSINPHRWYFSNPNQSAEHTEFDLFFAELVHTLSNDWRLTADAAYAKYEQHINYFYPFGPFGAYGNAADQASVYAYDMTRHSDELTLDLSLGGDFELFGRK